MLVYKARHFDIRQRSLIGIFSRNLPVENEALYCSFCLCDFGYNFNYCLAYSNRSPKIVLVHDHLPEYPAQHPLEAHHPLEVLVHHLLVAAHVLLLQAQHIVSFLVLNHPQESLLPHPLESHIQPPLELLLPHQLKTLRRRKPLVEDGINKLILKLNT